MDEIALEVAGVTARLGFTLDSAGADRFEEKLNKERALAAKDVKAHLSADYDGRQFDLYERKLDETAARVAQRDRFKAKLGGDFDARAFASAQRELIRAAQQGDRDRTAIDQAGSKERIRIAAAEVRETTRTQGTADRERIRAQSDIERAIRRRSETEKRSNDQSLTAARELRRLSSGSGGGNNNQGGLGALIGGIGPEANDASSALHELTFAMRLIRTTGMVAALAASVSALATLATGATAAVSALGPLVGLLATVPVAAGAAAQALGTIGLAASGVGTAVKAGLNAQARSSIDAITQNSRLRTSSNALKDAQLGLRDAHEAVGDAQFGVIKASRQLEAAQRGVASAGRDVQAAQRGVADAEYQVAESQTAANEAQTKVNDARVAAAKNLRDLSAAAQDANSKVTDSVKEVASAETRLGDAQHTTQDAQVSLTAARRDAKRALDDLNESAADSVRDEQRAVLDLADARDQLTKVTNDPAASPRDKQRAALDVADAEDRLGDAQRTRTRATQDAADADKAGVDGSPQVTAAIKAVVDSSKAETAARQDVADAQHAVVAASREAAQAERDLTDAQKKGVEGADDVVSARKDLKDANHNLTQSEQGVKDASVGVTDAIQKESDATFALTEARRGVVDAQRGVRDATEGVDKAQRGLADSQADAKDAVDKGTTSMNAYLVALRKLSPAQQSFVKYLISLNPLFTKLQNAAGEQLFKGVEKGVRSAMANFSILQTGLVNTSKTIGDLVAQAGKLLGSKAFGSDLQTIMGRNNTLIRRVGEGFLNLAHATTDVVIAAGPLVDHISEMALRFTELIKAQTAAGRENGKLGKFFDETRKVLDEVLSVIKDVTIGLFNIGKLAFPVGSQLLGSLTKSADKFREWTESAKGKNAIAQYFRDARPALYEFFGLVKDVTKAFFILGRGDNITPILHMLRVDLLPALETVISQTSKAFGPAFIGTITQIAILFSKLAGDGGPLVKFFKLLDGVLTVINTIIDKIPLIGVALSALIVIGGLSKVLGMASAISGINGLISRLRTVRGLLSETEAIGAVGGGIGGLGGGFGGAGVGVGRGAGGLGSNTLQRDTQFLAPVVGGTRIPRATGGTFDPKTIGRVGNGRRTVLITPEQQTGTLPRQIVTPGTFNQQFGNIPDARFAGPVSTIGEVRGANALGTAARTVRGVGAAAAGAAASSTEALAAVLGGPIGIAIAGAIGLAIVGSANKISRTKTDDKQADAFGAKFQQVTDPTQLKLINEYFKEFDKAGNKLSIAEFDKAYAATNKFVGGIKGGQEGLDKLVAKFKSLAPAVNAFVANLGQIPGAFQKVRFQDVLDPNAAAQVLRNFDKLKTTGITSIEDLRKNINFNLDEIGKAFKQGTPSWQKAMSDNIGTGIQAVVDGMRDGRIAAKDGTKAIADLTKQNMTFARNNLATLSLDGKNQLAANFRAAADAVTEQMRVAGKKTQQGMQAVRKYLESELQVYGFSLTEARNELKANTRFDAGPEEGSRGTNVTPSTPSTLNAQNRAGGGYYARGGWIGGKGMVGRDTVPIAPGVMAARGEWHGVNGLNGGGVVINRHQAPIAELALRRSGGPYASLTALGRSAGNQPRILNNAMRKTFGSGLQSLFSSVRRPHYMASGGFLQLPATFTPTHQTDGLPGYPAIDNFAPPGTSVGAPISGRIVKLSGQAGGPGGGGPFGYSIYESGGGKTYFLTHFGSRNVRLGQRVSRGQVIGTVADYPDRPDHIHEGLHGGALGVQGSAASVVAARMKIPQVKYGGAIGATVNRALQLAGGAAQGLLNRAGVGAGSTSGQPGVGFGPQTGGGSNTANEALGKSMAASAYGWTGPEWSALDALWQGESGWSTTADNPTSPAYGIPQSDPGDKMASEGPNWLTDAATQIRWGLKYIKGSYGDPVNAYRQWLSRNPHWYGGGGSYGSGGDLQLSGGGGYSIGKLKKIQSTRISAIDDLGTTIDRDSTVYEAKDELFGRTEEVYINPTTGAVDQKAIERRASELSALLAIRNRMLSNMEKMKTLILRVIASYTTIINRLREQYKHANSKDRTGIKKQIATYIADRGSRQDQLQDLGFNLQDIHYDIDELMNEGKAIRGTVPTPADTSGAVDDSGIDPAASSAPDTPQLTPDQQAVLDQNAALQKVVNTGNFLNDAALRTLIVGDANTVGSSPGPSIQGSGIRLSDGTVLPAGQGVTVVQQTNYMLTPSDPAVLMGVAKAANAGNGYLGYVPSSKVNLGL